METTTGESEGQHFAKLTENKGRRAQAVLNAKYLNTRLRIVGSRFQVLNLLWTWSFTKLDLELSGLHYCSLGVAPQPPPSVASESSDGAMSSAVG